MNASRLVRVLMLVVATSSALSASTAAAATTTSASTAVGKRRVLVLDFTGATADIARAAATVAAAELEQRQAFDVVTNADVRAVMDREANLQEAGCDESESCMAELAGALGASIVLHGSVTNLGGVVVVSVNLFNTDKATSLGRRTEEVGTIAEVPAATRRLTRALLDDLVPQTPLSPWLVGGGVVAGVGAAVAAAGLGTAAWAFGVETDVASTGTDKGNALRAHAPASILGVTGLLGVVVGAALLTIPLLQGDEAQP